jgi:hypothetical protein
MPAAPTETHRETTPSVNVVECGLGDGASPSGLRIQISSWIGIVCSRSAGHTSLSSATPDWSVLLRAHMAAIIL